MGAKAITTVTFAVTFQLPAKVTIQQARASIKEAITGDKSSMHLSELDNIKVHLLNKETSYGKR